MPSHVEYRETAKILTDAKRILITTHLRPDGDGCGSMRALADHLKAGGATVDLLVLSPLAKWYADLFETPLPVLGNDIQPDDLPRAYGQCDLLVIVDTNSLVQLPGLEAFIQQARSTGRPRILVIDHHVTGDHLGDVELLDSQAAAVGEIIFDLFKTADWPITPRIAEAIFVALSTDTGWFRYGNADSRIFHTAAELVSIGVRPNEVYRRIYQSFSPARLALMTRMLEHLTLHADGRIATQYILRKDFDETGASGPDTENLIDECQRIATVEVAVLLVELSDGRFRCSLRSKGAVDVRAIAQAYGGGGHILAAGVTMDGPLDKAIERLVADIKKQMSGQAAEDKRIEGGSGYESEI